jgi:hypothetical protein
MIKAGEKLGLKGVGVIFTLEKQTEVYIIVTRFLIIDGVGKLIQSEVMTSVSLNSIVIYHFAEARLQTSDYDVTTHTKVRVGI